MNGAVNVTKGANFSVQQSPVVGGRTTISRTVEVTETVNAPGKRVSTSCCYIEIKSVEVSDLRK